MNWGWRIAIFYGAFVVFMVGMVIMAFQQDFDLVAEDYYSQELAYQDRIDQMTNAKNDNQQVTIEINDEDVRLAFLKEVEDVKVHLFRPSDDTMDFLVKEAEVDSILAIKTNRFSKGKYLVKVEWKANGKTYFQETNIYVN